jgi:hypothetical protein
MTEGSLGIKYINTGAINVEANNSINHQFFFLKREDSLVKKTEKRFSGDHERNENTPD